MVAITMLQRRLKANNLSVEAMVDFNPFLFEQQRLMYFCHRLRSGLSLGFKLLINPNNRGAIVQLNFGVHSAFHQWTNTAPF